MNCNLGRRTIPFIALFMLAALSWLNETHAYTFCKTFWIMWLKLLENVVEEIISVKLQIADGLLEVGLHLKYFSKTLAANQQPFFVKHLFFMSLNLKSGWVFLYFFGQMYLLQNYVHSWNKVGFSENSKSIWF